MPTQLQWVFKHQHNGVDLYHLQQDSSVIMHLLYDTVHKTAVFECMQSRRKFTIEEEGFLKHKRVLKNEYGVRVGSLDIEGWFGAKGYIELNNLAFYYKTSHKHHPSATIYNDRQEPLLVCDMLYSLTANAVHIQKHQAANQYSVFLMALGWLLFLPAEIKKSTLKIA